MGCGSSSAVDEHKPSAESKKLKAQGDTHFDKKDYDKAIELYTQAAEKDPKWGGPIYNRGLCHENKGDLQSALTDFQLAEPLLDPKGQKICVEAQDRVRKGVSKDTPAGVSMEWKQQGDKAFDDRNWELALDYYTKAIEADPTYANPYYNRGLCYENLDRHDEAHEDLVKAENMLRVPYAIKACTTAIERVKPKCTGKKIERKEGASSSPSSSPKPAKPAAPSSSRTSPTKEDDEPASGGGISDFEFKLHEYKGSKIYNLNQKEKEALWNALDVDRSGMLDINELHDLAKAFWNEQKARGDERADFYTSTEIEEHVKELRRTLKAHMDTDKDGKIRKDEFIKKWNDVAREAFGGASCSIM